MKLAETKFKNTLKTFETEGILIEGIVKKIQTKLPNYNELKANVDLIEHILQIMVDSIPSNQKIDLKQLAIKIINNLFTLNANEMLFVENIIDYFLNSQGIKKISNVKYYFNESKTFLKKKFVST